MARRADRALVNRAAQMRLGLRFRFFAHDRSRALRARIFPLEELGGPPRRTRKASTQAPRPPPVSILEAVRERVSEEAAERLSVLKKTEMAAAAEQLLAATDWLPPLLRTAKTEDRARAPDGAQGADFCSQAAE